jgi:two-component system OmpR family sensor kinase
VTVRRDGDEVELRIADDGPGMAPEVAAHVFDRFYRADESRARATGGHGLGLAIAGEIARAHGGAVSVSSRPGQGSTFTVTLPLSETSPARGAT